MTTTHPNRPRAGVALALGAWLVLSPAGSRAGDWHNGASLVCSDCHTVHNSEDGVPMRYDGVGLPAERLLRAEDSTQLCLACHDGTDPDAPDVTAPVTYLADPAGGWFAENPVGEENPYGHDLLRPSPVVAPGGVDAFVLSCVSCHAPHGSDGYRNLLLEPPGSLNAAPVTVVVDQAVTAGGGTPGAVYDPANLGYRSGFSAWCNDCHGDFHGRTPAEEGTATPWLRHPQDEPLAGAYGADFAHWSGTFAERVPVESPDDPAVPSADDRVFCLSCHKAHGSAHRAGLIFLDGATALSTCQQCHNQ